MDAKDYNSDRVFSGVRVMTPQQAADHKARVLRALSANRVDD